MKKLYSILIATMVVGVLSGFFVPAFADDAVDEIIAEIASVDEECYADLNDADSAKEMDKIANKCDKTIKKLIDELDDLGVEVSVFDQCVTKEFDGVEHTACYDPIHVS